jgi:hypothetical protein
MMNRIITSFAPPREQGGHEVFVKDDFDTIIEKLLPSRQPSSALEDRQRFLYTKADGDRAWIPPVAITYVGENEEPEEE